MEYLETVVFEWKRQYFDDRQTIIGCLDPGKAEIKFQLKVSIDIFLKNDMVFFLKKILCKLSTQIQPFQFWR